MADATDSKSVMGNHVWVRAPSPVLTKNQSYITVRLVFYSSVIIPVNLCHVAFSGGSQGLAGTMDGSAATVVGGTGEVYDLYVVCSKDGAKNTGSHQPLWSNGSADSQLFEDAINNFLGTERTPVKYTKSDKGKELNRWFICAKNNSYESVEIWVGDGSNDTPMFRLWPDTQPDYN